jgi:glucosamine-6-phosphate deaminase
VEVIIEKTPQNASRLAARIVAKLIREKPGAVLGLATGSTPLALYAELARMHAEEQLDFSQVTSFNLDEYVGIGADHPASYHAYMQKHLFQHVNISPSRAHIPDGLTQDIPRFCREYEERIAAAGGIDLQVLGIGSDGHIGFNEPTSSLSSRTRIKTLTEQTRLDNAQFFGAEDKVPRHVITMGIGSIMASRVCLMLAFGKKKAPIVAKTVEGPVTALIPASALQYHNGAKIVLDHDAAAGLTLTSYYNYVYQHKPAWQSY